VRLEVATLGDMAMTGAFVRQESAFRERVDVLEPGGPAHAWVIATNVYHRTAQGWRLVAHHASPGTTSEIQEVSDAPSVLH
jgi:ketosteroid isomerase-like protein